MTRKLNTIPHIPNYEWIRQQMNADLEYRLKSRKKQTSLGRPLYERINVQLITTQECPYHCPFCLEKQNPMCGNQDQKKQLEALKKVLDEHPNARLTVTGGEPGLYTVHVSRIVQAFKKCSNNVFVSINTAGYDPDISNIAKINLSVNNYVKPDLMMFPGCTYQTVLQENEMTVDNIKKIIEMVKQDSHEQIKSFSFRFLSELSKHDYSVDVWNNLMSDPDIRIGTFRIGDFFVYATFDYKDTHCRITLGDMWQQKKNVYEDGYSNIIIHPDGIVRTNWK